jgi:hypothetical protein
MNQEDAHEVAPAPMGSLFEVTQLNTLRSRLKYGDLARRNSKKNMENDLVSTGVMSVEEAEEMFELFKRSLSRYLFDATVHESRSLLSVRESSTLFFTAIITVTSLHIPGKEKIHALAHKQLRDLIAASFFDRFHTLEDIRALCIAAFWLPDLSWKLSGHCVRIATELNLHQAFFKALYSQKQSPSEREHAFERARLWYLLYVLDHHFSIAYGRPPVTAELQAIKEYDAFLNAPECTPSDRRVLSQVTLFIILSKAYNHFGLEAERLMDGDDVTLLTHQRFIEDLDRWRYQFRHALNRDAHVGDYPAVGKLETSHPPLPFCPPQFYPGHFNTCHVRRRGAALLLRFNDAQFSRSPRSFSLHNLQHQYPPLGSPPSRQPRNLLGAPDPVPRAGRALHPRQHGRRASISPHCDRLRGGVSHQDEQPLERHRRVH